MARYSGTLVPVALVLGMVVTALDAALLPPLTWERPAVYVTVLVTTILSMQACLILWRTSGRRWPSVLVLTLFYERLSRVPIFVALVLLSSEALIPTFSLPDWFTFALLVGSCVGFCTSDLVLWLGSRYGFFDEESDPFPFRPVFRALRAEK